MKSETPRCDCDTPEMKGAPHRHEPGGPVALTEKELRGEEEGGEEETLTETGQEDTGGLNAPAASGTGGRVPDSDADQGSYTDVLDANSSEVIDAVSVMDDTGALKNLLAAEKKDKKRVTVIRALEDRLTNLKNE